MEEMGNIRVVLLFKILAMVAAAETWPVSKPGCPDSCDNISIPYPYGIGRGCFMKGFEITCQNNDDGLLRPFSGYIEVINISLPQGEVRMFKRMAFACYNQSGGVTDYFTAPIYLTGGPRRLSNTRNKFTAIGCDTLAYISSETSRNDYMSGCLAVCRSMDSVVNGSCSGIGCCQTSIPENLDYYAVAFDSRFNHSSVWDFNPCSFAFVADQDWYSFNSGDVNQTEYYYNNKGHVPIVLDWAIRTEPTCEEAERNMSTYACESSHSECINSMNGPGYLCNCSAGYQGNPYLPNGCQGPTNNSSTQLPLFFYCDTELTTLFYSVDIDECSDKEMYPCFGICRNTPGSYECLCPTGAHGNPRIGCSSQPSLSRTIIIAGICVGGGILLLLAASVLLTRKVKQRNIRKRRDKFFHKNRGLLLQQLISSDEALMERMKIFTLEELESATNNFDSARIVGKGGHGMVYKGILSDQRIVAIKKSKITNQSEIDQFINEVIILSQINHRNVVKLFGCCLEDEVPLLVYEFISGGTLFDLLHVDNNIVLSLEDRLRIATEIAGALAYLHTAASISIFHRDVKSSNILLNENYDTKVSDFGASRSVPLNQTSITTAVQGTFGYLDPEYFQRCHLTEKSDVYSFGVILLELLTRKTPISDTRRQEERNLAMYFIYSLKQDCLFQILDPHLVEVGKKEDIEELARVAEKCLRLKGEERPTMKEVEQKLDHIRRPRKRKQKNVRLQNNDVAMDTQGKSLVDSGPSNITRQYSLEKEFIQSLNFPR